MPLHTHLMARPSWLGGAGKTQSLFLLIAFLIASCIPAASPVANSMSITSSIGITVSVTPGGAYTIVSRTPAWTFGGSVGQDLATLAEHSGSDTIGGYKELDFTYQAGDSRSGGIRTYETKPIILFTDQYLSASSNSVPFPHLTTYPKNLSHLSYAGAFARYSFQALGSDGPWLSFDAHNNAFLLSPASNFMIASLTQEKDNSITSGITSAIPRLPPGFTQRTFLVIGQGINTVFDMWGQAMTDLSGKKRPANDGDVTLNTLGYWTDTGAAYYYNFVASKGYIGTLLAVRDSFRREGIPLGYMELDSWWYLKGSAHSWQGDSTNERGGIYLYTASPELFPQGLAAFQQGIGLPLGVHARWIDPTSPYRQQYRMSNNVSIDPQYWNYVASYLQAGGVITYKQDWLNARSLPATNLTDPQAFMDEMAHAMAARGITIQYCMALPRHYLQSSLYNNVTTIRVNPDRFERGKWDQFLYASRLAGALGIWPFADVFMSTERNNLLLATLSAGMVGIGDPIGAENKANLFRSIRADGVIVKPDVPIVPLDDLYVNDARRFDAPMIASTYTDHSGMKAFYVFVYRRGQNTSINFIPASLGLTGRAYVYNYFTHTGRVVETGQSYSDAVKDTSYYIVVPIGASGIAFLGDAGKFVSLGKKRISQVEDNGSMQATIIFARGEKSLMMYGYSPSLPRVIATKGKVGSVVYNTATGIFTFVISPDSDETANVTIGK